MRFIFIFLLALVSTAQAQQINPVPDYIFRNQMSVGRNTFTDTAAYMSIGPRYGAVKGFMPPIVTDTNAVTGVKRNGLLIFSIQLNNFAYWDSTTARFRKITAEASVDSLIYSTRAWRKKGDDSLGAIITVKTDTGLLSTKAYRQKGIDSVVTLISTLGGGTVLSVSAGTGMNFSTIITSGAVNADTLILSTRAWRQKAVDSLGGIATTKLSISDTAAMLGSYLRKSDTTAMLTPYLRKVDTVAMLGNYVRAAGYGLVKGTQTLSTDTAAMATRARVQKGIDSVAVLFTSPDTLTLSTRAWRQKGDDSLGAIISTKATATGTTNYLSKFTGTSALGNSIVYATTSEVGISTPSPTHTLDVNGRTRIRTIDSTGTGMNMLYSDANGVIKKAAIPAGGSGTVTSVATGFGLSGGAITTTGTIIVDTSLISTKANEADKYVPYTGGTKSLNLNTKDVIAANGRFSYVYVNAPSQDGAGSFNPIVQNQTSGQLQAATYDSLRAFLKIGTGLFSLDRGKLSITGNTAIGENVLRFIATGTDTIQLGNLPDTSTVGAGFQGSYNTGVGLAALGANIHGSDNTAVGANALQNNTVGFYNSAFGHLALGANVRGWKNTSVGAFSMFNSTSGTNLTGVGFRSLANNTTGSYNTAVGNDALLNNTTGYRNTALGAYNGQQLTTGNNNTLIGYSNFTNLITGSNNTVIGASVSTPSSSVNNNIILSDGIGNVKARHDSTNWNFNSNYTTFTGGISANGGLTINKDSVSIISDKIWQLYLDTTNGKLVRRLQSSDTFNLSTRAWRQKGIDSVSSLVAAKLNISDTATMLTNYTRGSGTDNYAPKWQGTRGFVNSQIFDNGTNIGINNTIPSARLHVSGVNENEGDAHGQIIARSTQAYNATPRAGIIFQINQDSDGNGAYVGSIYSQKENTSNSDRRSAMIFSTRSSSGTATERMRITSGGLVGINNSSPSSTTIAHISRANDGTVAIFDRKGGTINPGLRIDVSETNNTVSLNPNYQGATSPALQLLTQEIARMHIFANGRISINNTTDAGYQFDVEGSLRNTTAAYFATTSGSVGIGNTSPSEKLHVTGRIRATTIDSTSTAMNMLYADTNGVIKKSAVPSGLTMADDAITASGSWVATKDAGSGTTINNVAYTTNGTTKMVTVDGNFYIAETSFNENAWNEIGTIPSGFRPSKTVNWNNNFIVSGAEYEQTGGTDFTGALEWTYAQIRIKDTGVLEVIGSITGSNTIAAGGTAYIIVPFQVSYIIK